MEKKQRVTYRRRTNEEKHFIVDSLAQFRSLAEVARLLKERFDIELTSQAIECYDPAKTAGATLCAELRERFNASRSAYVSQIENVPCAHRAYRLEILQEGIDLNRARKNYKGVADLMAQAAKEIEKMDQERAPSPAGWSPPGTRWIPGAPGMPMLPHGEPHYDAQKLSDLPTEDLEHLVRLTRKIERD